MAVGEERRVEEAWIPADRANAPMDNLNSVAFIFSVVSVGEDVVKVVSIEHKSRIMSTDTRHVRQRVTINPNLGANAHIRLGQVSRKRSRHNRI